MNHCPNELALHGLLDNSLPESVQATLAGHLDTCATCQHTLEVLAAAPAFWSKLPRHLPTQGEPSEPGLERVIERLQASETERPAGELGVCLPAEFLGRSDQPGHLGRVAHYEVVKILGQGGMSVVLQAIDTKLNRAVALKVLAPELARHATSRQRFVREAQAAAALRNDHVVAIYSVEEERGVPYLVMERIVGLSLQERIDRDGPLPVDEVLRIGMHAALGLAAAHDVGLVHRDVKPGNLLLEESRAALADFGLAQAVDEPRLTKNGWLAGTPQYMSPEQARGEAIDPRSDLFSLGSVLFAACTGRAPFTATSSLSVMKQLCDEPAPNVRKLRADVPEDLAAAIARLHAKNPAERFPSAREVAELLRTILAHRHDPSQPKPVVGFQRSGKRRWLAAAAIVMVVAGGLAFTEAVGITQLVIRVATPDGTFIVEVKDPAVKVTIEGEGKEIVIAGADVNEVRVQPGKYRITATKDGKDLPVEKGFVTIERGGREIVRVSREIVPELNVEQKVQQAKKALDDAKSRMELAELARYDAALSKNPADLKSLVERGHLLNQLNRLDDAVADFSKVIAAAPEDRAFATAYSGRAWIYQQRGDIEKSIADWKQHVRLSPQAAWPYGRIAEIYLFGPKDIRDAKMALEWADRSLQQTDVNWNFHTLRGICLYRLEHDREAVDLLEQAYLKDSNRTAWNRYYTALCYRRLGDAEKAKACYDHALKLPPNPRWPDEIRAEADAVFRQSTKK